MHIKATFQSGKKTYRFQVKETNGLSENVYTVTSEFTFDWNIGQPMYNSMELFLP